MAEPSGRALAVVDVSAVERNCRTLKERAGEGTELCAVVKANGYGHGAATCAAAALRGGATWLAVAAAKEAEELRLHFPDTPILVMGALTEDELRLALTAHAEIAVWREGFRELCSRVSADLGRIARVHVKLDSGMGRLGTRAAASEILAALAATSQNCGLGMACSEYTTSALPASAALCTALTAPE